VNRRIGCVVVAAAVVAFGLPLMAAPALANPTILVTTTVDVVDAGDDVLSLREAITKANADDGADVIELAADATYELTICDYDDTTAEHQNFDGDLNPIDADGLMILGSGSKISQGCGYTSLERVITAADGSLVLQDLTIARGLAKVNQSYGAGSILIFDAPMLQLDHVRVRDSEAVDAPFTLSPSREGAAIRIENTPAIVRDSIISDNHGMGAISGYPGFTLERSEIARNTYPGGMAAVSIVWTAEIVDSWIHDNSVAGGAPSLYGTGGVLASPLTIDSSVIERNASGPGAGAIASSNGLIEDSIVRDNSSGGASGAMLFTGTVRRTAITGNEAVGAGGAGLMAGTVEDSTVSGNKATRGGGLAVAGDLIVRRSTISMNTAAEGSGIVLDRSGGTARPNVELEDATVAGNHASPSVSSAEISAVDPALELASIRAVRSIVGDGSTPSCALGVVAAVTSSGDNFFSDSTCGPGTASDIVNGGDPGLGPLQDNGGSTWTRVPLPGSPVRDRIPLSNPGCAGSDQRGVARPQGLGCDIGAVEAEVAPSGFVGVSPVRVLDTRVSPGQKVSGPGSIDVKVAGANGVPAEATAVVVNVTSTEASSADAFVTVWPTGLQRPGTSTLNLQPGGNVANSATIAPGIDGKVSLFTNAGATHLVVDVLGYYLPSGDRFTGVDPKRVLDTRTGPVPGARPVGRKLSGPGSIRLPLAGAHGIPADVSAVVVNITTTEATSAKGFVTAWPAQQPRPGASNLNLQPAFNVSNLAFVKVGEGGAIDLYTNTGATHLIVDVVGWFRPSAGDRFMPIGPARVFDSRSGAPLPQAATQFATVAGVSGIPAGASSVVLNATSTQASSAGGFLTVHAKGSALPNPLTSNVNYRPPYNTPNQVVSRIGDDESVALYNGWGTTHIVIDATGYFVSTS
jgi:hypothetical protein